MEMDLGSLHSCDQLLTDPPTGSWRRTGQPTIKASRSHALRLKTELGQQRKGARAKVVSEANRTVAG